MLYLIYVCNIFKWEGSGGKGGANKVAWLPYLHKILRIEKLCRLVDFDERQTITLVKGKQGIQAINVKSYPIYRKRAKYIIPILIMANSPQLDISPD